jgi:hypothetical protein
LICSGANFLPDKSGVANQIFSTLPRMVPEGHTAWRLEQQVAWQRRHRYWLRADSRLVVEVLKDASRPNMR